MCTSPPTPDPRAPLTACGCEGHVTQKQRCACAQRAVWVCRRLAAELGGVASAPPQLKPLVSRQIAKYKQERASTLTVVQGLLEQLNACIRRTVEGQ